MVRIPAGQSVEKTLTQLRQDPNVLYAEPNYYRYKQETRPNDPLFSSLWGLENTGQDFGLGIRGIAGADIDAPRAWDLFTGSRNIVVGIIDSGLDYTHPDLIDNVWTNPGEIAGDGIDNDGNGVVDDVHGYRNSNGIVSGDPMPLTISSSHGTHVAGTIGAKGNNGIGVSGVNWDVTLIAANVRRNDGFFDDFGIISSFDYFINLKATHASSGGTRGADVRVINNSWGGGSPSQADYDTFKRVSDAGIILVFAAGNSSLNLNGVSNYPSSYNTPGGTVYGPPTPNLISVASTDWNDNRSAFSNYGSSVVHLGAPGDEIHSTVPLATATAFGYEEPYASLSGTSMAAPQVTGAIALLQGYLDQQGVTLTPGQIIERVMATGDVVRGTRTRTISGRRLNLYNLLTNTRSIVPPLSLLTFSVSSDKRTYRPGDRVILTFRARTSAGSPAGQVMQFSITRADGRVMPATRTLDRIGNFTLTYFVPRTNATGTYTVQANSTTEDFVVTPGTTTFTVTN